MSFLPVGLPWVLCARCRCFGAAGSGWIGCMTRRSGEIVPFLLVFFSFVCVFLLKLTDWG